MIENIGAYSQVDYDRGYQQGRTDGFQQGVDDTTKRYKDSYMARDIKQIRADAIEEYMNKLCDKCIQSPNECYNLECPFADDECQIIKIAEQLKEQKE